MMKIVINGEEREVLEDLTVTALLDELGVHKERVAVELNLEIVAKAKFEETILKEGDRVEIVSFVGGG